MTIARKTIELHPKYLVENTSDLEKLIAGIKLLSANVINWQGTNNVKVYGENDTVNIKPIGGKVDGIQFYALGMDSAAKVRNSSSSKIEFEIENTLYSVQYSPE